MESVPVAPEVAIVTIFLIVFEVQVTRALSLGKLNGILLRQGSND